MADAADAPELALSATQRALVVVFVMLATLMQTLDSTIANVTLPYMQGSLSASSDQINWVLTSYVVAAAIMTAPVGWLTARFGRKNIFLFCLVGFTMSSMLCGVATSLPEMVFDRLLQGTFGAALVPLSQSTMLDIYPAEKRAMAMSVWGMGVMLGPVLGPTIGGYLTLYYSWRYVFFINLPIGILTIAGLIVLMPRVHTVKSTRFDWIGFLVLSAGLASLQLVLDRGQELDWFSSTTIIASLTIGCLGIYLFVVHMMMAENTFIPRSVFADRNLNTCLIMMFSVGLVVLASSALLPPFLEKLANFPVAKTGLVMAPRGGGVMVAMLIAGRLSEKTDARLVMLAGYILLAVSLEMIQGWTDQVSVFFMVATVTIQGFGLGLIFVPLQIVAFYTVPPEMRTQAASLISLVRNFGSAMGVSITSAILARQTQYEHAVLTQYVTPFSHPLQASRVSQIIDPTTKAGAGLLDAIIDVQAQIVGYIDAYKFLMLASIPAAILLLLLRPRIRGGALAAPAEALLD